MFNTPAQKIRSKYGRRRHVARWTQQCVNTRGCVHHQLTTVTPRSNLCILNINGHSLSVHGPFLEWRAPIYDNRAFSLLEHVVMHRSDEERHCSQKLLEFHIWQFEYRVNLTRNPAVWHQRHSVASELNILLFAGWTRRRIILEHGLGRHWGGLLQ